jgi:competence protein ComEC
VPALLLLPSAALFLTPAARLPPNQFELTLLDVGQGLSAVVRTRHHLLVYDTGPSFPSGFNTGSAVVAPYLRSRGLNHIDLLVLSHGDNDHVGGARGLLRQAKVARIVSGEPVRLHLARKVAACREGTQWWWDGVHFAFLSPPVDSGMEGNDASCVLRISSGGSVLLITGDIEAEVENRLVAAVPRRLRSSVVVAAHHGSSSSSSPAFVAAAQPRYVLFSAGVDNRWHFPRREVVARWCKAGARTLNTAAEGAIRMRFTPSGAVLEERHARSHRHYWQNGSRTDFSRSGRKIPPACSMIAHYETED